MDPFVVVLDRGGDGRLKRTVPGLFVDPLNALGREDGEAGRRTCVNQLDARHTRRGMYITNGWSHLYILSHHSCWSPRSTSYRTALQSRPRCASPPRAMIQCSAGYPGHFPAPRHRGVATRARMRDPAMAVDASIGASACRPWLPCLPAVSPARSSRFWLSRRLEECRIIAVRTPFAPTDSLSPRYILRYDEGGKRSAATPCWGYRDEGSSYPLGGVRFFSTCVKMHSV